MLEELKEEGIVNKVGGRFKLSTLIQKRLVQLNRGGRPLVDLNSDD
jgi:DNA-directed RNA polymerase subunit omega